MDKIVLDRATYRDKMYACWLGKNIGGTLGGPHECKNYALGLDFYQPVPDGAAPNDDLDLQLVWLAMMEKHGLPPKLSHFADFWLKHLHQYQINEYDLCLRNLERGLRPPVSGWFENSYIDEMGSPIRSEIWACLAPADPQTAAALAWHDAALDHAGGEGMYGEMFLAAIESAAFVVSDTEELIRIGLSVIPPACRISQVVREVLWCWRTRGPWGEWGDARNRVLTYFGHEHPCHAIKNIGFFMIGWLYGKDFGDKLCQAVNCGYDTDCTAATLGSLLGIIGGTAGIPKKWSDPVGKEIKVINQCAIDAGVPQDLDDLARRTEKLAVQFVEEFSDMVEFGDETKLPAEPQILFGRFEKTHALLHSDLRSAHELVDDVEIILHYNGDPALRLGEIRRMQVSCRKNGREIGGKISAQAPSGWQVTDDGDGFWIKAGEGVADRNSLTVKAVVEGKEYQAAFVILGPQEAKGYPAGDYRRTFCPKCTGHGGWCICKQK